MLTKPRFLSTDEFTFVVRRTPLVSFDIIIKDPDVNVLVYSPLGGDSGTLVRDPTLARVGAAHDCSAAAIALAWATRSDKVIAIPESGSVAHVKENAVAQVASVFDSNLTLLGVPPSNPHESGGNLNSASQL